MQATGFHLADELLNVNGGDAVVIFARGRRTRDLDVIIEYCAEMGAHILLITGSLAGTYKDSVEVILETKDSRAGLTRETISSSAVTDALMLGVGVRSKEKALETSAKLTELRGKLISS